ncbi:hypothetical protein CCZ01_04960 [Helicobacter monodelphidis]|uniref:lipid A biosynthesis lauroyl acyltransferase n=1 Tax=Helicobacter sp. 15-1451 TaxID=2004995 RepID=UPI000DCF5917|nr:lipid A biosynthesis lauroyl acyltransferase [Helicobacter sp. 15-1451]RAX57800.1 hypothetical protein CCZ01_04960 [Helicobacter sp. 15-1451]
MSQTDSKLNRLKIRIFEIFFYTLAYFFAFLPHKIFMFFVKGLAWIFYILDKRRKKDAKINLDFVYQDNLSEEQKKNIIKRGYLNFAFSVLDFVRLSVSSQEKILQRVTIFNKEKADAIIPKDKPFVLITAHYGHWELISLCAGIVYGKMGNVGRFFGNSSLDYFLCKVRSRFGIQLINKQKGMREILKFMNHGYPIGLVVDQNTAEKEGVIVDFFGKKVRHTPSASILARRFDSVIIPVFSECNEDYSHFFIHYYDPIVVSKTDNMQQDILEATQKQAIITQQAIEKKPEEWLWFHRRFKNQYEEIYS